MKAETESGITDLFNDDEDDDMEPKTLMDRRVNYMLAEKLFIWTVDHSILVIVDPVEVTYLVYTSMFANMSHVSGTV